MDADATEACTIMGRYCDGDVAAFHRLYALLSARIQSYLTGILGDRAAAEDVLQQTFLKVHQSRESYVRGANPIPWIYTIAHRSALDDLRRRKRSRVRLTKDGELHSPPTAGLSGGEQPADALESAGSQEGPDAERLATTLAALENLPEGQRQALLLTKVHGRTHAEAALIMGSTAGAIKLRAHRAYVSLRKVLGVSNAADAADEKETT